MKKILSVFLTLAMMLTMLSLPLTSVSAVEPESHNEIYDTSKAVGGVLTLDDGDYTVITTAEGLRSMTGEGKYILGACIDFKGAEWGLPISWYGTLEGNGHTVTGFSVKGGGMFQWYRQTTWEAAPTIRIANVTFGAPNALIPVTGGGTSGNGLFTPLIRYNTVAGVTKGINLQVENMQAYVNVFGVGTSNDVYMGGLIGYAMNKDTLTFTNCLVDGSINGRTILGGYIGMLGSGGYVTANFENCINSVDIVEGNTYSSRGGFVGYINQWGSTVNVTNCINKGNVSGGTASNTGALVKNSGISALVGECYNKGKQAITVNGFLNLGTITHADSADTAGVLIGYLPATCTLSATNVVTTTTITGGNNHGSPEPVTSADDLASGKAAALLGKGFGQEIGVETMPKIGGMPVIERVIGEDTYYGNVIDCEDDKATVYAQFTADNGGLRNHRVLIAVPEAYLAEVTSVTFRVTYTLTEQAGGGTAVAELTGKDVSSYYVVKAANGTYATEDGVVLLAVVIEGVPTNDWTEMNVTLAVTGSDAAVAAYTANATFVQDEIESLK